MRCLICKKTFFAKKSFCSLLKNEKYIICDKCYKQYPIKINYCSLPLNKHILHIYSLYPKAYFINSLAYSYEYSKVFSYVISKTNFDALYFSYDYFKINMLKLDIFEDLSSFYDKDIYIICNYLAD